MLRTRLWMGSLLIALVVLLLAEDQWFAPWYPILFCCYVGAILLATRELLELLPADVRPCEWLTMATTIIVAGLNWWPALQIARSAPPGLDTWDLIGIYLLIGVLAAFVREMWLFRGP